jgi:hypothetical protein
MADSNFIANQATLGNYVQGKEITLLDYNVRIVRMVDDRNDRIVSSLRSSSRPGFILFLDNTVVTCIASCMHVNIEYYT